jgi:hypothetical protein
MAQTKDDVVAIYKRFSADLEQKRNEHGGEMRSEYFALITYDFPDKFSQAPA